MTITYCAICGLDFENGQGGVGPFCDCYGEMEQIKSLISEIAQELHQARASRDHYLEVLKEISTVEDPTLNTWEEQFKCVRSMARNNLG